MSARMFPAKGSLPTKKTGGRVGTVRIGGLAGLPAMVAEMGSNLDRLLARCGIDPQIFNDSENIIPFGIASRLILLAAEETRCPHFGLLLGQRHEQQLSMLGPIGFLMQNSPSVGEALRNLNRYLHLHVEGGTCALQLHRGEAVYTFTIDLPGIIGVDQMLDSATATLFKFMRMLCGREWLPSAVCYAHRSPADTTPYRNLFRAPVLFDQEITGLYFPASCLELPVPNADPDRCNLIQSYIAEIEQQYSGDFPGQMRNVVRTMLPTGKCAADRLAELFSMHLRTLQRRLADNGTTFEAIVDETRQEIATHHLAKKNTSISQLSAILGYHDSRAFIRAFRRWTGATPTEWRTRHRS